MYKATPPTYPSSPSEFAHDISAFSQSLSPKVSASLWKMLRYVVSQTVLGLESYIGGVVHKS